MHTDPDVEALYLKIEDLERRLADMSARLLKLEEWRAMFYAKTEPTHPLFHHADNPLFKLPFEVTCHSKLHPDDR